MSKYKFYKNKKTKYHPSIHISIQTNKIWENIEITSSPTKEGRYIKLIKNPNPNTPYKEAWFRKYIRKDPLWAMGEELRNYSLCKEDEEQIDLFLKQHIKNKANISVKKRKRNRKKKTR